MRFLSFFFTGPINKLIGNQHSIYWWGSKFSTQQSYSKSVRCSLFYSTDTVFNKAHASFPQLHLSLKKTARPCRGTQKMVAVRCSAHSFLGINFLFRASYRGRGWLAASPQHPPATLHRRHDARYENPFARSPAHSFSRISRCQIQMRSFLLVPLVQIQFKIFHSTERGASEREGGGPPAEAIEVVLQLRKEAKEDGEEGGG